MKIHLLILFIPFALLAQKKDATLLKKVQAFDNYIQQAQKDWQIPGLAITVVKDGKVLLQKGYGVRELGKSDAVNTQTLFACASTTKAMTAVAMGILVDEGKVSWSDPVQKHLPNFLLYDTYMTREITVRDLFTHNTGVGNADFLWALMNISSDEVLKKMRDVEPSYSLRSSFIYQNIFYLAAGKIIENASGKPWHVFMNEKIFQPLGMTRTYPFLKDAPTANMTMPHYKIDGKITAIEHFSADQIAPAGSVWSSIEDMTKWMTVMIDSSKYQGGRLLSKDTWVEMFKPQVIVPAQEFYPTASLTKPNWTTYGLGWFQQDYQGRKVNLHTGSLDGAIAIHAQLPSEKLGLYVFGNLDHAELRHALIYKAFDDFALGGTVDWSKAFLALYQDLQSKEDKQTAAFESKRVMNTKTSLPLAAYAGNYTSPLYGELTVTPSGDMLALNLNDMVKATLPHWHFDMFYGDYDKKWFGKANAQFFLNGKGEVSKVSLSGLEFTKVETKK